MQMPTIKLQSSDGEMFEVDVEIAKQSVTIKTMLEGKMWLRCCAGSVCVCVVNVICEVCCNRCCLLLRSGDGR